MLLGLYGKLFDVVKVTMLSLAPITAFPGMAKKSDVAWR